MIMIGALIGVDLGRRLKKLGEKWGGGASNGGGRGVGGPEGHSGAGGVQRWGVSVRPADSQRRGLP